LTRKKVDRSFITDSDMNSYRAILEATHGYLENNDPSGVIKTTRSFKFKEYFQAKVGHIKINFI